MAIDFKFLQENYGDRIEKRIKEYQKAIDFYLASHARNTATTVVISFEENTATTLAYLYFHWLHHLVKPFVKDLCDRYKVASITEIGICYLQPILSDGQSPNKLRAINADFAFYCAMNIVVNFNDDCDDGDGSIGFGNDHLRSLDTGNRLLQDRMEKVMENHKRFLITLEQTDSPPLITNAFVLDLVDLVLTVRWQAQVL